MEKAQAEASAMERVSKVFLLENEARLGEQQPLAGGIKFLKSPEKPRKALKQFKHYFSGRQCQALFFKKARIPKKERVLPMPECLRPDQGR